jgi:Leucine-rich repeat (LRR) protein
LSSKLKKNFNVFRRFVTSVLSRFTLTYSTFSQPPLYKIIKELAMNNNDIKDFADIDVLAELPKLEYLSLMGCPLTSIADYRLYTIFRVSKF